MEGGAETEELVMQTAQSGGASVAEGLEELDSMPAIWGDAKAGCAPPHSVVHAT